MLQSLNSALDLKTPTTKKHPTLYKQKPRKSCLNNKTYYHKTNFDNFYQPKLLVTIGPVSQSEKSIRALSKTTNLFRLNGSHNTIAWHEKISKRIKRINPNAFILFDIPGYKPRTNNDNEIKIQVGDTIEFFYGIRDKNCKTNRIGLSRPIPFVKVAPNKFSLSDGQFEFETIEINTKKIIGRSKTSFTLLPRKGLNIPGSIYDNKKQQQNYSSFIRKAKSIKFDAVGLSFIQNASFLADIKKVLSDRLIISKIENQQGLLNCKEITRSSDSIMIDRGDLSAEVGFENLFDAVSRIANEAKYQGVPLIMATENLDSMNTRLQPSKSEIIALQHSINLGTDVVMLSDETATSNLYLNTTDWLTSFLEVCSRNKSKEMLSLLPNYEEPNKYWSTLASLEQVTFLLITRSGEALNKLRRLNKYCGIIIVTDNRRIERIAQLHVSIKCEVIKQLPKNNIPLFIQKFVRKKNHEVFGVYENLVALFVGSPKKNARADTLMFFKKG